MDIDGLHLLINYLREDFKSFKNNEFHSLEEKVDKLVWKIAAIFGGITVLVLGVQVAIRLLT